MTPLTARDRLKHLLRDYADAADERDPNPPGPDAGNTILPGRWSHFEELDHWLRIMRTCTCTYPTTSHPFKHKPACTRPMHWHLNERYIRPHARTMLKRWTGKHLPRHSERATHHHTVTARKGTKAPLAAAPYAGTTLIARWHPAVNMRQVELALDWLLEHMHAGDTTRINLPPDLRDATPDPRPAKRKTDEESIAA